MAGRAGETSNIESSRHFEEMAAAKYHTVKLLLSCESVLADRQGFEPWRRLPAYTRSRRAPSTTRPPVRDGPVTLS